MRVLVATDLSKPADEAIRQAAALAGPSGFLAAVHVLPSLQAVSMLFPQAHAQEAVDVPQILFRVADIVKTRVSRITERETEIFIEEGSDYGEIVKRAEEWNADIIVVGSHGHTGLAELLGGVAQRVVRHAHCRVLVARESETLGGPILVATDLSEPSLPAVVAANAEAQLRGVPLKVVHAVDFLQLESAYLSELGTPTTYIPPDTKNLRDPAREWLTNALRKVGITADHTILDGAAAPAIVNEAKKIGANLIVVGSHGRTGLARFLLGSVAEKIVRSAPCSVLVVRMDA